MITVEQAENIIFEHALVLDTEGVPLMRSLGRVLAEDLVADRDFPPFDRVTMDGIAIRFQDFERGQRAFKIVGIQAAGIPQRILPDAPHICLEVMTGAILPTGCDTVIRYEDLRIDKDTVEILIENIDYQQNIHEKGIDKKAHKVLVEQGCVITAAEIATAATVGKTHVQVVKLPNIAIISTGDELVDVAEMPLLHQIRRSNVYAIQAMLASINIASALFHFNDDEKVIAEGLDQILNNYDLVILSGAVSEGKFDFVPKVLDGLGVEKLFHKVAQRPGKPFWFGIKKAQPDRMSSVVFALPGNPVSTFLCAYRYVLPFLQYSFGLSKQQEEYAVLNEDVSFKPDLTYFLQVKVVNTEGVTFATPITGGGSGDLANLNKADGFLELRQGQNLYVKGNIFPLIRYRL